MKCMLVSVVCGIIISKVVRDRNFSFLAALVIGTSIGFLGAIGIFGLVYPFYIAVNSDVVTIPEVVPYAVYFLIPQIKIYSFTSDWGSFSIPLLPIVAFIFVIISIVSVLFGQIVGRKWFWRDNVPETLN